MGAPSSPKKPSWTPMQSAMHDLFIILRDPTYWKEKKAQGFDLHCIEQMVVIIKEFNNDTITTLHAESSSFRKLQDELIRIATTPRKTDGFWSGTASPNEVIARVKAAVLDLLTLSECVDFNQLRKDYAETRKNNEMLLRVSESRPKNFPK